MGVGAAMGTAAAGLAAQRGGTAAGFAVCAVCGAVALAVLLSTSRILTAPNLAGLAEKDPNRAVEPRFSTSHQA